MVVSFLPPLPYYTHTHTHTHTHRGISMYIDCEFVECHLGLIIKYSVTVLEKIVKKYIVLERQRE